MVNDLNTLGVAACGVREGKADRPFRRSASDYGSPHGGQGGHGDGAAELRAEIPGQGGTLIGGDLFDFFVGPLWVGFFGVVTAICGLVGHRADLLRSLAGPDLEPVADLHRSAGPALRPGARAAKEGGIWQVIGVRARSVRIVGAARGGDMPQARHRLSRAGRLRLRDLRLFHRWSSSARCCSVVGPSAFPMASSAISIGCRRPATNTSISTTIPRT